MRGKHEQPRDRRRSLQPAMLVTGVLAALATTGGVITAVGWTGGSTSETFTVHAARIPRMARPSVRRHAHPRISWTPVRIADAVPVQRYVVTRHLGPVTQVACDVPATAEPVCTDRSAPAGYQATYTVTARHGTHWTGEDSEPSRAVTVPGLAVPVSVDGVLIVPGTAGAPVVLGTAPDASVDGDPPAPSDVVANPGTDPSSAASAPADVDPEPPVIVAPAPPVHGGAPDTGGSDDATEPGDRPDGEPDTESATVPADGAATEDPTPVSAD